MTELQALSHLEQMESERRDFHAFMEQVYKNDPVLKTGYLRFLVEHSCWIAWKESRKSHNNNL